MEANQDINGEQLIKVFTNHVFGIHQIYYIYEELFEKSEHQKYIDNSAPRFFEIYGNRIAGKQYRYFYTVLVISITNIS